MKTVIMAGGRGTRISELFPDIPKPLIPIEGIPVLERELISLRDQGFKDIIMTVSHMGDKIMKHFGDGTKLGVPSTTTTTRPPQSVCVITQMISLKAIIYWQTAIFFTSAR